MAGKKDKQAKVQLERIMVAVKSDKIVLRDPRTMERLTTKGKLVPKNAFWLRRLKAKDVIILKTDSTPGTEQSNKHLSEGVENGNTV